MISLIPAYTKSTRLQGKNTFKFMLKDKPLIAYTIEAVKNAGFLPHVFTNERDIDNNWGAEIIARPENISTPKTTMKETVKKFIEILGVEGDDIILLTYLTCPFRTGEHIKNAIDFFNYSDINSLMSISPVNYRPYGLIRLSEHSPKIYCLQDQKDYYQKQNTPSLYKANGAIYIFKVSELDKLNNQMFNDDTVGFVLDEINGIDIDTKLDFMLAEAILNERASNQLSSQGRCEAKCSSRRFGANSIDFEVSWT